jgi:hypothetical protein
MIEGYRLQQSQSKLDFLSALALILLMQSLTIAASAHVDNLLMMQKCD